MAWIPTLPQALMGASSTPPMQPATWVGVSISNFMGKFCGPRNVALALAAEARSNPQIGPPRLAAWNLENYGALHGGQSAGYAERLGFMKLCTCHCLIACPLHEKGVE